MGFAEMCGAKKNNTSQLGVDEMASKNEKRLKEKCRRRRPLTIETRAHIVKRPKNDGMSPGRLVAVAEWR